MSMCSASATDKRQQNTNPSNCNLPSSHCANDSYSLPATAESHVGPPDIAEGHAAYSAWLDETCAHVRGMAIQAGIAYHREKLAALEGGA